MRKTHTYTHREYGDQLMCLARGKLVPATPEEHVRQSVIRTLIEIYGYPRESIAAEEPVARGTDERGRADVVVSLPGRLSAKHRAVVLDDGAAPTTLPYSECVREVRDAMGEIPGLELVPLRDLVVVQVDGSPVECRVLGFIAGNGPVLWLEPIEDRAKLPDLLGVRVASVEAHQAEREIAAQLGLPGHYDSTEDASDKLYTGMLEALEARLSIDVDTIWSDDGRSGWAILCRHPMNSGGVLARVEHEQEGWESFLAGVRERYVRAVFAEAERDDLLFVRREGSLDDEEARMLKRAGDLIVARIGDEEVRVTTTRRPGHCWLIGLAGMALAAQAPIPPGQLRPFIVVECKAQSVSYSSEVLAQGRRYAEILKSRYLVVTNGIWAETHMIEGDKMTPIAELPSCDQAVLDEAFLVAREPADPPLRPLPPGARDLPDTVRFHVRARESVGDNIPSELWLPILVLEDLIHSPSPYHPESMARVTFEEDLGMQWHEPGNVSGGSYPGLYRDFAIKWRGKHAIFGVSVFGTSRGGSFLLACVSFGAVYHPALQLELTRYARLEAQRVEVWHSGRATVGKGQVKKKRVVDYVMKHAPELVHGEQIHLGGYDLETPDHAQAENMLTRLAAYAALRHQFKESVRQSRR